MNLHLNDAVHIGIQIEKLLDGLTKGFTDRRMKTNDRSQVYEQKHKTDLMYPQ